jgi:hypothetical protein
MRGRRMNLREIVAWMLGLALILFIGVWLACIEGCSAYHSGGAKYFYADVDPGTNATRIFWIESTRKIGPTQIRLVCEDGDNITISTEGFEPGPNNTGKALEVVGGTIELGANALRTVP